MQLTSCANLYAIIFVGVKCREVLIVVGVIVTMTLNVHAFVLWGLHLFVAPGDGSRTLLIKIKIYSVPQ